MFTYGQPNFLEAIHAFTKTKRGRNLVDDAVLSKRWGQRHAEVLHNLDPRGKLWRVEAFFKKVYAILLKTIMYWMSNLFCPYNVMKIPKEARKALYLFIWLFYIYMFFYYWMHFCPRSYVFCIILISNHFANHVLLCW